MLDPFRGTSTGHSVHEAQVSASAVSSDAPGTRQWHPGSVSEPRQGGGRGTGLKRGLSLKRGSASWAPAGPAKWDLSSGA